MIGDSAALQAAMNTGALSEYILDPGTYTGDFTVRQSGTAETPLVFRPAPGARVTINGSMIIEGDYVEIRDLEICYLDWTTRQSWELSGTPSDIPAKETAFTGDHSRFINCVIHDLRGVSSFIEGIQSSYYGCLIYHIGWQSPIDQRGHALYIQNNTPEKVVQHNIMGACFNFGIHAYTQGGTINNLWIIENTCFLADAVDGVGAYNILVGGYGVAQNPRIIGNNTYGEKGLNLGYVAGATHAVVEDNYLPDGITEVNANYDSFVRNFTGPAPASGQRVTVYPNLEATGRANITVYNWDKADSVTVDVSSVLAAGDSYILHSAQDYYGDVVTGNVAGDGTITIDMRAASHTVAAVLGWDHSEWLAFPTFGCFILKAT